MATASAFADSLEEDPTSCTAQSALRRRLGALYLRGRAPAPEAAVLVLPWVPSEPVAWGSDPIAIWELLAEIRGWTCVNVATTLAPRLAEVLAARLGASTRLYADLYYTLEGPVSPFEHPWVRRLTGADLSLVEDAPREIRPVGFDSVLAALEGGVAGGAVTGGRLVASISLSGATETFGEIGGATLPDWRGAGLATAAASLVARELRARGLVPVWSTGEENRASQKVAEKVGFRPWGRAAYVVVDRLRDPGGFQPTAPKG